jgi:hypothetical protein
VWNLIPLRSESSPRSMYPGLLRGLAVKRFPRREQSQSTNSNYTKTHSLPCPSHSKSNARLETTNSRIADTSRRPISTQTRATTMRTIHANIQPTSSSSRILIPYGSCNSLFGKNWGGGFLLGPSTETRFHTQNPSSFYVPLWHHTGNRTV